MTAIETLRVIHIDTTRQILGVREYVGNATAIVMPFREIASDVLQLGSAALILSHNHPSGDPTPSPADFAATRRLALLLQTLGVRLHDHIIRSRNGAVSFRTMGWL